MMYPGETTPSENARHKDSIVSRPLQWLRERGTRSWQFQVGVPLVILLAAVLFAGTACRSLPDQPQSKPPSQISAPAIEPTPREVVNRSGEWHTYTSSQLGISFKYPPGFRVTENYVTGTEIVDDGILIDWFQTEGPPLQWMRLTNSEKTKTTWTVPQLEQLYYTKLNNGETDEESKLIRLPDITIGSLVARVFEEKYPQNAIRWDRTIVLKKGQVYYGFLLRYVKYPPDTPASDKDVVYIKTFDQILGSIQFLE